MHIPLKELISYQPIVGLMEMTALVIAAPLTVYWEWLPLFWKGRGTSNEPGSSPAPLEVDIESLPRRGLMHRWYEWNAEARSGRTRLGFDEWLARMALPRVIAAAGIVVRQNALQFHIRHARRYLIVDSERGNRVFECRIDGRLPIIAFVDVAGRRGPWLMLPKLLTIEEIVSLRPLTQAA